MTEPESPDEERSRRLGELEGKNIAHYSVMLSAYISSRIDANKAIFTFSLAATSLLLVAYEKPASNICTLNIVFSISVLAFVLAVISTLFIYVSNTKAIEAYISNENESSRNYHLKSWVYVNYIAFGVGVIFSVALGFIKIYG